MRKNKKLFFILFTIFVFMLGVGAASLMDVVDVSFNNAGTKITSGNVQGAIEELEKKFKSNNITTCTTPAEPNLNDNLIPVKLSDDGIVTYADITTKWYDYCNKEWANAVMLVQNPSKVYGVNDVISEDDIKAYFVWIPKYKYKLWNVNTTNPTKTIHSIDIVFDVTNTTDVEGVSCATPMTTGNSGNCNNGEYMTHPAFISMNVNGFWIGKFKITGSINSITTKPGVTVLKNQNFKTFFESIYYYSRENDSHMIKNTEWGAVAYLSHSKYGIDHEVNNNNNNSATLTGYSALPSTDQHSFPGTSGNGSSYNSPYNTEVGYLASTTGNITGVYDMSGCAWEGVMGYRSNTFSSSGFNATTIAAYDSKYYDVYSGSIVDGAYQYRILGDAMSEMGPFYKKTVGTADFTFSRWYYDNAHIIHSTYPWVVRGGHASLGIQSGQFDFNRTNGAANSDTTTRIVLSP